MSDEITPEQMRELAANTYHSRNWNINRITDALKAGATALERCAELERQLREAVEFEAAKQFALHGTVEPVNGISPAWYVRALPAYQRPG